MDRDANEIAYYIQIKVLDFIKMIEKLRNQVFDKLKGDENMEENKDWPKEIKPKTTQKSIKSLLLRFNQLQCLKSKVTMVAQLNLLVKYLKNHLKINKLLYCKCKPRIHPR